MNRFHGCGKAMALSAVLALGFAARGFAADATPSAQKVMEDVYTAGHGA